MKVLTPMVVTISVHQGHRTEGFLDATPLASRLVERWYMAPGVCRVPVTESGLSATLFLPSGRTRAVDSSVQVGDEAAGGERNPVIIIVVV